MLCNIYSACRLSYSNKLAYTYALTCAQTCLQIVGMVQIAWTHVRRTVVLSFARRIRNILVLGQQPVAPGCGSRPGQGAAWPAPAPAWAPRCTGASAAPPSPPAAYAAPPWPSLHTPTGHVNTNLQALAQIIQHNAVAHMGPGTRSQISQQMALIHSSLI